MGIDAAVRQPTMRRLNTSDTNAVNAIPDQVGTYVKSTTHKALAHNVKRLPMTMRARSDWPRLWVVIPGSPNNIVVLTVPDAAAVAGAAREQDVLVSALGPRFLRLVTHLDVDDDGIDKAIRVLRPLIVG